MMDLDLANAQAPVVFDGHNDVLLRLSDLGPEAAVQNFINGCAFHIDAPKARAGGFGGGFFAVFVPSPPDQGFDPEEMTKPAYDLPLPEPMPWADAMPVALSLASVLFALEAAGALRICRTVAEISDAFAAGEIAAVFHMEGAEAIDEDLAALDLFYQAGLRSLGPVWSRPTIFGHGVPFRFPGTADTGPGLTDAGRRLVTRCNELGIMLDVSHLNEAGFWDLAKLTRHPIVATHSNAAALCPHSRNLSDQQLDAIAESDGMVGLNFAVAFLREDGRVLDDVPLDQMMRHLDHLIARLGEDRVGFGSDFDGAIVPRDLGSSAGLPALRTAMAAHGFDAALMKKLCHENWLRVLRQTWGG